jgi:hypothetical protein
MGRYKRPMVSVAFSSFEGPDCPALEPKHRAGERSSQIIGTLAVIGNVEAFELSLLRCPEADGQVDDLV